MRTAFQRPLVTMHLTSPRMNGCNIDAPSPFDFTPSIVHRRPSVLTMARQPGGMDWLYDSIRLKKMISIMDMGRELEQELL